VKSIAMGASLSSSSPWPRMVTFGFAAVVVAGVTRRFLRQPATALTLEPQSSSHDEPDAASTAKDAALTKGQKAEDSESSQSRRRTALLPEMPEKEAPEMTATDSERCWDPKCTGPAETGQVSRPIAANVPAGCVVTSNPAATVYGCEAPGFYSSVPSSKAKVSAPSGAVKSATVQSVAAEAASSPDNAESHPVYSAAQLLQIGHLTERSKADDMGYRSYAIGESGDVAPQQVTTPVNNPETAASCSSPATGIVYCDLDGTLSDFQGAVADIFQCPYENVSKKELWARLFKTRDFFANLPWLSEGKKLWEGIRALSPVILSGVPNELGGVASAQKRRWVRRELGDHVPILTCFKKDKWRACRTGDILIDDDEIHRKKWEEQGGVFIHHTGDAAATLSNLASYKPLSISSQPAPQESTRWVQAQWSGDWWWCKVASQEGKWTEVEFMEPPYSGQIFKLTGQQLRWPRSKR